MFEYCPYHAFSFHQHADEPGSVRAIICAIFTHLQPLVIFRTGHSLTVLRHVETVSTVENSAVAAAIEKAAAGVT